MALSEDVFDDTMTPCEKLYNAEAAFSAIAFSGIGVISLLSIFMIVAPSDDGLPDHWK